MEVSVETDEINILELNSMRDTLESMSKFNQVEVLRILSKHKEVMLNENKYGVHINLSDLKGEIIDELKKYINYVNTQEIALHQVEQQKETFKNIYFTKDNKDIHGKTSNTK
jgi:hypothetical protein